MWHGCLSILETATQGSPGFTKMFQKKRKYPFSGSSLSENVLLRSEVGTDRKATVTVTLCHSFQLRVGEQDSNSHGITKIGQQKREKTFPDLISLNIRCDIQTIGSEFDINKASCLLLTVQAGDSVIL